jgi:hypothetical protein
MRFTRPPWAVKMSDANLLFVDHGVGSGSCRADGFLPKRLGCTTRTHGKPR